MTPFPEGQGAPFVGIGWRREIAGEILSEVHPRRQEGATRGSCGIDFVEVLAEDIGVDAPLPAQLVALRSAGVPVAVHGVSLGLGGAEPPDEARLARLAVLAERLGSTVVSEHAAFVRAGELETGHLLPVPRTDEALAILVANVRHAQARLPVPLALENIAPLFRWPRETMDEGTFLRELLERTGAHLLLDLANLHAAAVNLGVDPEQVLDTLPLERIAYTHIAGGVLRGGLYHDTHAHPVGDRVFELLDRLLERIQVPGILLERDDRFPPWPSVRAELATIRRTAMQARVRPARSTHGAAAWRPAGTMGVKPINAA